METILYVAGARLDHAIFNSGVLDHLVRTRPGARFTIVCGPQAQSLMAQTPGLDRLIVVHQRPFGLHAPGLLRRVLFRRWDLLVDLDGSPLSRLIPARQIEVRRRSKILAHQVREAAGVLHLEPPPLPRLHIPADAHKRAEALLPPGRPILGVCLAAQYPSAAWPEDRFAALARRLTGSGGPMDGAAIAVFGGHRADHDPASMPQALAVNGALDLTDMDNLTGIAACMARVRLFIGNDSGLLHLAAAMGAPTLGLYGPTDELRRGPVGRDCAAVRGPAGHAELTGEARAWRRHPESLMTDLTIDAAAEAASRLLARTAGRFEDGLRTAG
ncbi:MAG: glycosyltransferase family 9 protein [Oceanicaulis sp.]|nr:glycosyltransferase family 9 protein [Oceanicaulis sp.]